MFLLHILSASDVNLINTCKSWSHGNWFQLEVVCSMCMLHCAHLVLYVNPSACNSYCFSCLNNLNTARHCGLMITIDTQPIRFPCPLQLLLWHIFCVRHAALWQSWLKCKLLWLNSYMLIYNLDVVGRAIQGFF